MTQNTHMKKSVEGFAFKVIIIEDPLCKRGGFEVSNHINNFNPAQISARLADIEDAERAVHLFNPDIAFIDLHSIHPRTALELGETLRVISPLLKVIYSSNNPPPLLGGSMPITALSGWAFWINSSVAPKDDTSLLINLLSQVSSGDVELPMQVREEFMTNHNFLSNLSPQQRTTIDLLAQGFSNKEIARIANLNLKNVERNISKVTEILGVNGIEHENNKRILLVLEYLRRVERPPSIEFQSA